MAACCLLRDLEVRLRPAHGRGNELLCHGPVEFDARRALAGKHGTDAAELLDHPLLLAIVDFVKAHDRFANQLCALGAQLIEQHVGRKLIEAGHEDGRFADSRFGVVRCGFHWLNTFSDPTAEHMGGRFRIALDDRRKLLAE